MGANSYWSEEINQLKYEKTFGLKNMPYGCNSWWSYHLMRAGLDSPPEKYWRFNKTKNSPYFQTHIQKTILQSIFLSKRICLSNHHTRKKNHIKIISKWYKWALWGLNKPIFYFTSNLKTWGHYSLNKRSVHVDLTHPNEHGS